ncbi:MAG: DNA methyltransferase [Nitrospiraceae bacterium]
MSNLSWNEIRDRAIRFSREWADAISESGESQTFWNEFFDVFGVRRRLIATFEEPVLNIKGKYGYIDLFWRSTLLVEHKSRGKSLAVAESQAFSYIQDLARDQRFDDIPRFVIVSDFAKLALYDLEPDEQKELPLFAGLRYTVIEFPLSELHRYTQHFAFLKGERTVRLDPEDPANQRAYDRMCQLHDELERGGLTGTDLERLLVRLLFCLFAEDTGIFEPNAFQLFIRNQTREDGSDLGARLNELFDILNTAPERRPRNLHEDLALFPYVNGQLFGERLAFPSFTRGMRESLLEAANFQWARVSPAVFGSLFVGIMLPRERRQQGAHYTSERDIMKVIRSLFLDELRAEFERVRADRSTRRRVVLEAFSLRLRKLHFLDPACGCGDFLILAYRELRLLELDVLRDLYAADTGTAISLLVLVNVDQFYGIECDEWPTRIAEVAMWLMDHQMNQAVTEAFGQTYARLPLEQSPHIVQGNALRLDWRTVLAPEQCSYILGNPPFIGKQYRNAEQQADMDLVWNSVRGAGVLDYVTCWYRRAAEYISNTHIKVAFVSTNSITQGEQVGILWGDLFSHWHLRIHFAHRTFAWTSEARGGAQVHCVIIGFGLDNPVRKPLYEYDPNDDHITVTDAPNISPYLLAGSDVVISKRTRPLCGQPEIVFGSMPNDGGHLLLSDEKRNQLLIAEPDASRYLRPLLGSEELLNGINRWCLWLVDVSPGDLRQLPEVMKRVDGVRIHRQKSTRATTRELANTPTLFGEIRQPTHDYLAIPSISSENRRYIPMAFLAATVIGNNKLLFVPSAGLYEFGILTSQMHMAWVRVVTGRIKSDFQYSNQLVYNNFPWPAEPEENRRRAVEAAAQAVLDARAQFLPPNGTSTLADLYDPLSMPPPLSKAHTDLDRAVDRCYRPESFGSDRERVEHLFALYERLIAPLLPATPRSRSRRRSR